MNPPFMDNAIDRYCPPGYRRDISSSSLPIPPFFTSSIAMEMREVADCASTIATTTGQGINADVLTAPSAVVCQTWFAAVKLGLAPGLRS